MSVSDVLGCSIGRGRGQSAPSNEVISKTANETLSDVIGEKRSRGRGRGRGRPQCHKADRPDRDARLESQEPHCDLADRFKDDDDGHNIEKNSIDIMTSATRGEIVPKLCIPESLFGGTGKASAIIYSVNFEQGVVVLDFIRANLMVKCRIHLHKNTSMCQWEIENAPLTFSSKTIIRKTVLSALELLLNRPVMVHELENRYSKDGYLRVSIDMFGRKLIRECFRESFIYMMIPRLPEVDGLTKGIITNVRANGELDVLICDDGDCWLYLRKALRALQKEKKLLAPRFPVFQQYFKELFPDLKFFLAPLNNDWSDLHRVKVVGIETDNHVKVEYIDLGKSALIHLDNLAFPLAANCVPELICKIPPQALTLRVDKLDSSFDEILKSMQIENRVCFIQALNDSGNIPIVNIYLDNNLEVGTVSLFEMANSWLTKTQAVENHNIKAELLKALSKQLEDLTKEWQESLREESESIQPSGFAKCHETLEE